MGSNALQGKANSGRRNAPGRGTRAVGGKALNGVGTGKPNLKPPRRTGIAPSRPDHVDGAVADATATPRLGWREAIDRTVSGLHYEVVDVERAQHGLLRITIDRNAGHVYPGEPSEFVTVEDCEQVTRQLQFVLEVDSVDYARLEVSSPGLDRPLHREADYRRFAGQEVSVTLKLPFEGRKVFKGVLASAQTGEGAGTGWTLTFAVGKTQQVLGFTLEEVREARLVPVLDFKGRRGKLANAEPVADGASATAKTPTPNGPGLDGG